MKVATERAGCMPTNELVAAARKGERVVVTRHGQPVAERVRCDQRGGIDFARLEAARRRLGIESDGDGWPAEFNDPALSRCVLGLNTVDFGFFG